MKHAIIILMIMLAFICWKNLNGNSTDAIDSSLLQNGRQHIIIPNVYVLKDTVINSDVVDSLDIISIYPTHPVIFRFKNNRISAKNTNVHIVILGGEHTGPSDHMLDNMEITGNKISWKGTDLTDSNEGILIGYCVNVRVSYNFIFNCPYGTPAKSDGFTYTSGGIAYNVYGSSFKVGTGAKGTNGVRFYNNTFYNNRKNGEGVVGSIYINSNNDIPGKPPSTNCQIINNLFYTKHQVANIYCDNPSLAGLMCDYNMYYCEEGEPVFKIGGKVITLTQWQAMGYDKHSVVLNPQFIDFESLIPSKPLPFGKQLEAKWQYGLDPNTQWNGSNPMLKAQGSAWQVGAYIK